MSQDSLGRAGRDAPQMGGACDAIAAGRSGSDGVDHLGSGAFISWPDTE